MTYTLKPDLPATPTPKDYSRIHFDPSEVPPKRIVGLLACQRDPLLRRLTSKIVSARPAQSVPVAQKGRQKKGKNGTPAESGTATPVGNLWEVELEDTIVFPEGGGQPWDTGRFIVEDANGDGHTFTIEGCVRRGLDAVHLVRVPDSAIDFSTLPSSSATVEVDWDRRQDHMITHTAQHLLSAVLDTRGLPTLSWAMSAYPTTEAPYVELSRGLTWQEAQEVEQECNAYIRENRRVWIDVTIQSDEGVTDVERRNELERENRVIPKDYTGGVIRHCNIDGIDRNACCGTQCPDLSIIGFLHVLPPSTPWAATEPSSKAATRLYFVAGPRAVEHLSAASRSLSQAGQAIAVGRELVVERVTRLEANRYDTAEKEKALRQELAKTVGEAAVARRERIVHVHRTTAATHDFEFLNAIAAAYFVAITEAEFAAQCDGQDGSDKTLTLIVTSAPSGVTPALLLVQSRDDATGKALFEDIKAALTGTDKARVKGGGARGRFMAKIDGKWSQKDVDAIKALTV